jgi:hypothetical protein
MGIAPADDAMSLEDADHALCVCVYYSKLRLQGRNELSLPTAPTGGKL